MATLSLGESAFRGAAYTGIGQVARIALQALSIVVLARLLSPADYGLLAMVLALIGVGELFRDFGLSSAAIQARTLSVNERSNLFWLNTLIGILLTLVCFGVAPLIAALYGEPKLTAIAQVLAVTFFLNGLATQFRADLNRAMRFGVVAGIDVVSQAIGLGVGLALAMSGGGYWALVWMQVAQTGLSAVGVIIFAGWLPRLYRRDVTLRPFLKFGGGLLGSQVLNYAGKNVDSVIIGLTLGPVALGFYNRAFQLLLLPLNQLQAPSTRVALPVLARLQDEKPKFDAFLLTGQSALLNLVALILAFSASQAPVLFELVLGGQWTPSAVLFQALALGGLVSMANYACYWVFLAKGLTTSYLIFSAVTRPFLIAGLILGSFFGAMGVALAYSFASLLLWPATLLWLKRVSDAPVGRMFSLGVRTIFVYLCAALVSYGIGLALAGVSVWISLPVSLLGFVATLLLATVLVPPFKRDVLETLALRRFARRRSP